MTSVPDRNPHSVPRREGWRAAVFLLALLSAVHYDVVFQGRSFILSNHSNPLDYRSIPQNYGENMVPVEEWTGRNLFPYANIQDPGSTWWQWEPSGKFLRRAIDLREWPFWDPYIGGGTPAMANLTPAFFFPPYAAVVILGASVPLMNAYLLLLLWSAAFFTFLFLRVHTLAFASSLCGATVVLMSGTLNQGVHTIMGQTAACLPVCLYVTRRFLDAPSRRRTVALALVYAGTALASFPPVLLGVFGLTTLYVASAFLLDHDDNRAVTRLPLAARWAAVALISVGLVSFYYLPALMLRAGTPHVVKIYGGAALETIPLLHAYQLLSPTLMGGIPIYLTPPVKIAAGAHIPYLGMAALLVALMAGPGRASRPRVLFYASAAGAACILFKLFGIPPVHWASHLPLLNQIHFAHYLGFPLGFVLAFLSALGVESLIRGSVTTLRSLSVVALALAATMGLWWVAYRLQVLQSPADTYWIRDWVLLSAVTSLCTIVILTGTLVETLRSAAVASLTTVVVLEGMFNNVYLSPDAWDMFDHPPPYVRTLQQEAGLNRVLTFAALNANLSSAFEIFSLDSVMAFNAPRMHALYMRYTGALPAQFLREARHIPPELVLDRANIRMVAIRDAFPEQVHAARARGYSVRFNDGYVWLFERPTQPRFFFSSEYRVSPASEVLEAVASAPARQILLEERPLFQSEPNTPDDPPVQVESYRRNSVRIRVNAPRPGLVYASESFFDGWTARVNGTVTRILPANYAFRAVPVRAGSSVIDFHYRPPGLRAGLAGSGVSVLLLVAVCVFWSNTPGSST